VILLQASRPRACDHLMRAQISLATHSRTSIDRQPWHVKCPRPSGRAIISLFAATLSDRCRPTIFYVQALAQAGFPSAG
jgi:hypothetical protein